MAPIDLLEPASRARRLSLVLWLASAVTLGLSLNLPTVTFRQLASAAKTFSIYGGVRQLWEDGTRVLAVVVFLFSIVFPIAKLAALVGVFLRVGSDAGRRATSRWLELLGKWSLLDVFIVGVFVGSIRLGVLANASSRVGILVFGGSIVLSMLCARVLAHAERGGAALPLPERPQLRGWPQALLSSAALGLVVAALWLPVFEVKKAVVFKSQLELSRTSWKMATSGEASVVSGGMGDDRRLRPRAGDRAHQAGPVGRHDPHGRLLLRARRRGVDGARWVAVPARGARPPPRPAGVAGRIE